MQYFLKRIFLIFSGFVLLSDVNAQIVKCIQRDLNWKKSITEQGVELVSEPGQEICYVLDDGPKLQEDFIMEFDIVPKNSLARFGILTGIENESNWNYLG